MLQILLLVACSSTAFATLPLKLTDCNNSPNKIIHFENYHIETDPIKIPGNNSVDFDVQILQPISGNHFKLEFTVTKKLLFGWVIVPGAIIIPGCNDPSMNSCTFELCDFLSGRSYNNTNHCPVEVAISTPDFPCACPFQPGQYHLNPTHFVIKHLSQALPFLDQFQGDFMVHATVIDTATNEEVACYNVLVSTVSSICTGIQCLIGKK